MLINTGKLSDHISMQHIYDANVVTHDGTTPTMIDMKGWDGCLVIVVHSSVAASSNNLITGFKVVSNTTAAGAGTDHDIAEAVATEGSETKTLTEADYGTAANTTLNSQCMFLDVRNSQMFAGDRYIGAVIAATTSAAFPGHIFYFRYNGSHVSKDQLQATRTAFQFDGDT